MTWWWRTCCPNLASKLQNANRKFFKAIYFLPSKAVNRDKVRLSLLANEKIASFLSRCMVRRIYPYCWGVYFQKSTKSKICKIDWQKSMSISIKVFYPSKNYIFTYSWVRSNGCQKFVSSLYLANVPETVVPSLYYHLFYKF